MIWAGHVAQMGQKSNAFRLSWKRQRIKYHLENQDFWVPNNKMDFREIEWVGIDWISLAQDRDKWKALVNAVMNLTVP
jgi:hypothetical protein